MNWRLRETRVRWTIATLTLVVAALVGIWLGMRNDPTTTQAQDTGLPVLDSDPGLADDGSTSGTTSSDSSDHSTTAGDSEEGPPDNPDGNTDEDESEPDSSPTTVGPVTFRVADPRSCFADTAARRMTGFVQLTGAAAASTRLDVEFRPDRPEAVLLPATSTTTSNDSDTVHQLASLRLGDLRVPFTGNRALVTGTYSRRLGSGTKCGGYLTLRIGGEQQ